ncbi:MAG: RNase P subunit p30 family protein [Candidatus Nanoarchaeia archaeon]
MFSDVVFCKDFLELGFSKIYHANLIIANNAKDLRKKISKEFGLVVVLGSHLNRDAVSNRKVDILLSPHSGVSHDYLSSRNSGLNEVLCKLAKKNDVAVGFSFSEILNAERLDRSLILGRVMQNVMLCRKFKVPMVLGSFAFEKSEMRPPKDLISFGMSIGMTPGEAKKALTFVDEIVKSKHELKDFVSEGVKAL